MTPTPRLSPSDLAALILAEARDPASVISPIRRNGTHHLSAFGDLYDSAEYALIIQTVQKARAAPIDIAQRRAHSAHDASVTLQTRRRRR